MSKKDTSDGHHTFAELYEHRYSLFGALAKMYGGWKSKQHSDGTMFDGNFVAGVELPTGVILYHLPERLYDSFPAREIPRAPAWDGLGPEETVKRLQAYWNQRD